MTKVKTRTQLAAEYGINRRTLYNWLKKEGIQIRKRTLLSVRDLEIIYQHFGKPNK